MSLAWGTLVSLTLAVGQASTDKTPLLRVPEGFVVEQVATPELARFPMMAGFDDQGNLYVAQSSGQNLDFEELQKQTPNFVSRLEDTDGDGKFDRSTVFADKMTFPSGALWHQGALYVAAAPYIWKLRDTDDDGVADVREELVGKFGSIGNAADIHGCFLGPDGRIYWCDGRHGHDLPAEEGKPPRKGQAARIFSCLPDGSQVEVLCGGGMDNPVELAFTPEGEALGTVAILENRPHRRDALVHWVQGGVYPRTDQPQCLAEFRRTGDPLGPVIWFGQVAPSGVCRWRGESWGPEFADAFFIAQFNTHKVVRCKLRRQGATFVGEAEDFLVCDDPDFHPTDVLQDADGSLLVLDTGGWFRYGCPLSQVAKPEVPGGIYRIRRVASPPIADGRGLELNWDETVSTTELALRLDDDRFAVRDRAVDCLSRRGDSTLIAAVDLLDPAASSVRVRRGLVWALCRLAAEPDHRDRGGELLIQAVSDPDPSVAQAAVRALGTLRFAPAAPVLRGQLGRDQAAIVREAATALGRMGDRQAASELLTTLSKPELDRFGEHALIDALLEIGDPEPLRPALADDNPRVRRAAIIVLDQLPGAGLTARAVLALLDTRDAALRQAALEVLLRHPDWAAEVEGALTEWIAEPHPTPEMAGLIRGVVSAFADNEPVQRIAAKALAPNAASPIRQATLEAMADAALATTPTVWLEPLRQSLRDRDPGVLSAALRAVENLHPEGVTPVLVRLGNDPDIGLYERLKALRLAARSGAGLDPRTVQWLLETLDQPVAEQRLAIADVLGSAVLNTDGLTRLTGRIPAAGPLELTALWPAYEQAADADLSAIAPALVRALNASTAVTALSRERVSRLIARLPANAQAGAGPLLDRLTAVSTGGDRLEQLAKSLPSGDAVRGRDLFFGQKAGCFACHRVDGAGGRIGPDLSAIGPSRSHRDLLESIVLPSASFARGYETFHIATDDGRLYSGIIANQTSQAVDLITPDRREIRLSRGQIEEMAPAKSSIMPEGLDRVLSPQELADLIAFLKDRKA